MPLLVEGVYWVGFLKNARLPGRSKIPAHTHSSAAGTSVDEALALLPRTDVLQVLLVSGTELF